MPSVPTPWIPNRYPATSRSDHADIYKSEEKREVVIPDPYNWLEQDYDEVKTWIEAQDTFARGYLDQNPERQELEDAIRNSMNYPVFSAPSLRGDNRWYWWYNSGLQAQSVLYRSTDEKLPPVLDGVAEGEVFFDANLLSDDGTTSIIVSSFSRCGKYLAYGVSVQGSDFFNIYVRPTTSPFMARDGKKVSHDEGRLPDELKFVKFSGIKWTRDSGGFFYQRFPKTAIRAEQIQTKGDQHAMIYYHRIGTSQSDDVPVIRNATNAAWYFTSDVTELDGHYLILNVRKDTSRRDQLWIADLQKEDIGLDLQWDKLVTTFQAKYSYIANDGPVFYFLTDKDAPQGKVVNVDISATAEQRVWKDVIPEDKGARLFKVLAVNNDTFAVVYKRNVIDELYLYNFQGIKLTRLASDFVGTIDISGRRDESYLFATFSSFTSPGTIAKYNFTIPLATNDHSRHWDVFHKPEIQGLELSKFETRQVWYTSTDGTQVPMFLVRHKDTPYDGTAPALQYGYGGFSTCIDPWFSPSILTFVQKYSAVFAVPNIRGGGEFGEAWHQAGIKENKKVSYDDFIAATQYLVDNKYAAAGKVALYGGSNGGLLVAACAERASEGLIGAVVSSRGVHDLLKFADFTIGHAWTSDYGNPHDAHDFDYIYKISPVHNVPANKVLPPMLLSTADHDDRVVPLHSYKLAATLQHILPHNPHPLLLKIYKKSGHGAGQSIEQLIREGTDRWGFVAQSLGLKTRP